MSKKIQDVPSPIDLKNEHDAQQWAEEANIKRPWRYDFFNYYSDLVQNRKAEKVLEIGSGPGFLAQHLLVECPKIEYTAFDFSEAMHHLSRQKLTQAQLKQTRFIVGNFKQSNWTESLDKYEVVIIHQALHELRHKSYAQHFHQRVKKMLNDQGVYLVCDHLYADDAMQNNDLYVSKYEHKQALESADFYDIRITLELKGLCLFECKL